MEKKEENILVMETQEMKMEKEEERRKKVKDSKERREEEQDRMKEEQDCIVEEKVAALKEISSNGNYCSKKEQTKNWSSIKMERMKRMKSRVKQKEERYNLKVSVIIYF